MTTRLKHEIISGPNGEVLKINWMPDKRVRFDFIKNKAAVTHVFPDPKGDTHIEVAYGGELHGNGPDD